jgi:hypothetical protein
MRWQDLIYLKCPACSSRLEEFVGHVRGYWCKTEWCGFTISRRKLAEILLDETHILRTFLSEPERIQLAQAIDELSR